MSPCFMFMLYAINFQECLVKKKQTRMKWITMLLFQFKTVTAYIFQLVSIPIPNYMCVLSWWVCVNKSMEMGNARLL